MLRAGSTIDVVLLSEMRLGATDAGHRHALDRYYAAPFDRLGLPGFYEWPTPSYLGLASLGSHLARSGVSVALFDNFLRLDLQRERLLDALRRRPLVVGLSTTHLPDARTLWAIVAWVRRYAPNALLVFGGPNAERIPSLQRLADVTVLGDGEAALARIVAATKDGSSLDRIPNLLISREGRVIATSRENAAVSASAPAPDWKLLAPRFSSCLSIEASKGCRHNCAYCSFPGRGRQRMRPVIHVVEEMLRDRDEYGASILRFVDANLTSWPEWVEALCREIARAGAKQPWSCFARVDDFARRPALASLMREAGCVWTYLGIESGNDDLLRRMHKSCTKRDIREGMARLRAAGVRTHANFVVGFPGETSDTVQETLDLIPELGLDTVNFPVLIIPEGSDAKIAVHRERFGIRGRFEQWSHSTLSREQAQGLVEHCIETVCATLDSPVIACETEIVYYLMGTGFTVEESLDVMRAFRDFHRAERAGDEAAASRAAAVVGSAYRRAAATASKRIV